MHRLLPASFVLLACSNGTATDSPRAPVMQAERSSAPSTPAPSSDPHADPEPLQYNCQAPLLVIEEVSRFLTISATHATESAACVDGPGRRITIDEILVCPSDRDTERAAFDVTYRVTRWDEGGRQTCGQNCPPVTPEHTAHRTRLTMNVVEGELVLDAPKDLPGLPPDATPATQPHDGDCYGKSPAYSPRAIPSG